VTYQPEGPPVTYWKIFQYGATINAKNPSGMMWIPLSSAQKGVWPRAYPGKLFRRGNALFDAESQEPKYAGTPSVTIPKKWHLIEIVQEEAQKASTFLQSLLGN
jgi:hypothetical protein